MNDSIGFPKASWEILPLIHTVSLHCVCVCVWAGRLMGVRKDVTEREMSSTDDRERVRGR